MVISNKQLESFFLTKKVVAICDDNSNDPLYNDYYVQKIEPTFMAEDLYVTLTICSPDYQMTIDENCHSFMAQKLSQVMDGQKDSFVLPYNTNTKVDIDHSQMKHVVVDKQEHIFPYLVQYNESYYDFLKRITNRWGEFLYYEDGKWIETAPLEIHKPLTYPNIGPRESYLMHHEELESLVKNYPTIKRGRFWMTFGQAYLTHLHVIEDIGMSRIDEVEYEAPLADGSGKTVKVKIVPLQFLKAVLPNPQDLGSNYEGETSIGCRIRGLKNGKEHTYYIYNNCKHQEAYKETGMQGVSYTTGVPAMIGAMMFVKGIWRKPGVWNVENFDPDPFMEQLNKQGLPWHELRDIDLEL